MVLLWHCLLMCSLLAWLSYIFQLALGQAVWSSALWGLAVPLTYSAYRIIKRPSLSQIATWTDQRCGLQNELITAWQYRNSKQPALPLLLEQVSRDLAKVNPALLFNFKISPRYAIVALVLAGGTGYFYHNPLRLAPSQEIVQSIGDEQLQLVADQVEVFRKELNKIAPGAELPKVTKTAERLQQLARELDYPETKPQVMPQLQELKKELEQSIADEVGLPEVIQDAEHKPALIELKIKSERLAKMLQKLNKLGLSPEQIQNQALRELAGLLDRLIQLKMPGPGNRPAKSGTKVAGAKADFGQPEAKLPAAGLEDTAAAGRSGYNKSNGDKYQTKPVDWSAGEAYRASVQANAEGLKLHEKYAYLPQKYQRQVYAVLADQHIPLYYRKHVQDYFDALRN